jgi:hypothetical protein
LGTAAASIAGHSSLPEDAYEWGIDVREIS